MGEGGDQLNPVERLREVLREDPKWVNFVWHTEDPNYSDFRCHNTILHLLAVSAYGEPDCLAGAALVLEYGADANARNDMGCTPLHYACQIDTRDKEMVELLLRYGAVPNAANNCGETPIDWIFGNKNDGDAIQAMLIMHGARRPPDGTTRPGIRGHKRNHGPRASPELLEDV